MFLTKENYNARLQEHALMNHTSVAGVFETYKRFKPNRMPYELICELLEDGSVGINFCPYGDLIYNTNYSDYAGTFRRISNLLEKYGYWVGGLRGTIFKNISADKFAAVGEVR